MAQIKAYVKIDKEGITEYVDEYFDIEPDPVTGILTIKVPAAYEPVGVPIAGAYQWSYLMDAVAQDVTTIKSVENLAFNTVMDDAVMKYTTSVENMFNGATSLEDYSFFNDRVTSFNNTYRNTPSITSVVRIAPHALQLDNCFNGTGTRRAYFEGAPEVINNCFYGAKNLSYVEFITDMSPISYGNFLDTQKDSSSRIDIYMPEWETYSSTEHQINIIFKDDPVQVFGYPVTWEYETAKPFGIYYNKAYQIYVHYELPQPTDRKGIFINPSPEDTIMEAYRTSAVFGLE